MGASRFFGREVDHILVRGLTVVAAATIAVKSSDHNPVDRGVAVVAVVFVTSITALPYASPEKEVPR